MEGCGETDAVRDHIYTSTANRIKCITEGYSVGKTEWWAIQYINHCHFRLKGKGASLKDFPMCGLKSLPHIFD